ncbi:MAG: cysteine methyltransferase [Proteobacteria bacterium]|nr:MAG: cysteine methyltransferase [Pseudomonadota bacterium]
MTFFARNETPLGPVLIVAEEAQLTGLYFFGQKYQAQLSAAWTEAPELAVLKETRWQLDEYFAGKRRAFDLPLAPTGTSFQQSVWSALCAIPYGETTTYGALAESIRARHGVRAVGAAIGRNPISIVIPCHRVIGADRSLTGYAGGLPRKQALLELEGAQRGLPLASIFNSTALRV